MKILLAILLITGSAQATMLDNETGATEIANAMAHCPNEVAQLLKNQDEWVARTNGVFSQLSKQESSKEYTVETARGAGRITLSVITLKIVARITQPAAGLQNAPATIAWSCSIEP